MKRWFSWTWGKGSGTAPFVGVCWFASTVYVGLWPLVLRFGPPSTAVWELKRD